MLKRCWPVRGDGVDFFFSFAEGGVGGNPCDFPGGTGGGAGTSGGLATVEAVRKEERTAGICHNTTRGSQKRRGHRGNGPWVGNPRNLSLSGPPGWDRITAGVSGSASGGGLQFREHLPYQFLLGWRERFVLQRLLGRIRAEFAARADHGGPHRGRGAREEEGGPRLAVGRPGGRRGAVGDRAHGVEGGLQTAMRGVLEGEVDPKDSSRRSEGEKPGRVKRDVCA